MLWSRWEFMVSGLCEMSELCSLEQLCLEGRPTLKQAPCSLLLPYTPLNHS